MALVLQNNNGMPYGQFDGKDADMATGFKGGEVCTLGAVVNTPATDLAAQDVFQDGYVGTSTKNRPAVTFQLASGSRPLFLSDDGIANYGTLFGTVVGGTAGQVTTGAVLGPNSSTGSGKVTLWNNPGLYGVTLDAVDTAADGLIPTSSTALTVGTTLTYTATGKLTPTAASGAVGSAPVVARLVEFATNGSLVTTPQNLVAALNSPSGGVSSLQQMKFYMAVIFWQNVTA